METAFEDDFLGRQRPDGTAVKPVRSQTLSGIILAAGASSRMGSPKALLHFQGASFLDRVIERFRSVCDPVIVVTSGHLPDVAGAAFVRNPDPSRGMLSSLQCGLREIPADAEGVLFCPVDIPAVRPETIQQVAERFLEQRPPVALPQYRGKHGHPVCISRALAEEILALPVTAQARDVIHRHMPDAAIVDVDDSGVVTDIDTPEDYRALQRSAEQYA